MPAKVTPRRFPPPWSIEEGDESFASATQPDKSSGISISRMSRVGSAPRNVCQRTRPGGWR